MHRTNSVATLQLGCRSAGALRRRRILTDEPFVLERMPPGVRDLRTQARDVPTDLIRMRCARDDRCGLRVTERKRSAVVASETLWLPQTAWMRRTCSACSGVGSL
jgi:hypothetical protein